MKHCPPELQLDDWEALLKIAEKDPIIQAVLARWNVQPYGTPIGSALVDAIIMLVRERNELMTALRERIANGSIV